MATLLIRKTNKQSWSQAAKQVMLDGFERLSAWAAGMNEVEGWNKYAVEAPTGAAVEMVEV
ncbi:hypothetical protein QDW19_gp41 [Microbacterium phage AvGardian]|uniref:hypothetical protein n=1 Tax=Microbacterium phage AvGardian TaxID=2725619 RepID=UPI0014645BEB|nr:hypothetical protein QDW19_gp41 [Microbacterium phage AvGardian]QJD49856.1 hypothetical protein SEA_AVGARDIAN_41 [Microbacterium phage AvGardian]